MARAGNWQQLQDNGRGQRYDTGPGSRQRRRRRASSDPLFPYGPLVGIPTRPTWTIAPAFDLVKTGNLSRFLHLTYYCPKGQIFVPDAAAPLLTQTATTPAECNPLA